MQRRRRAEAFDDEDDANSQSSAIQRQYLPPEIGERIARRLAPREAAALALTSRVGASIASTARFGSLACCMTPPTVSEVAAYVYERFALPLANAVFEWQLAGEPSQRSNADAYMSWFGSTEQPPTAGGAAADDSQHYIVALSGVTNFEFNGDVTLVVDVTVGNASRGIAYGHASSLDDTINAPSDDETERQFASRIASAATNLCRQMAALMPVAAAAASVGVFSADRGLPRSRLLDRYQQQSARLDAREAMRFDEGSQLTPPPFVHTVKFQSDLYRFVVERRAQTLSCGSALGTQPDVIRRCVIRLTALHHDAILAEIWQGSWIGFYDRILVDQARITARDLASAAMY